MPVQINQITTTSVGAGDTLPSNSLGCSKRMRSITIESLIAGTIGALAMMPVGFIFRALQLRVGHYGSKFAELYLSSPGPAALFIQHIILGWLSAVPLALLPLHRLSGLTVSLVGVVYGVMYYAVVNSLALPIYFGDMLPWNLGWSVVAPSLVVHIVFGVVVAHTVQFLRRKQAAT
ncbi:MAG: hypothetical protein IPO13_12965 [Rhodocyclaceae bacterium]|nr:hypothetical protein [Rhodocyclaceae bacterium]